MKVVTGVLARNEADRFLRSSIKAWEAFSDRIILLDDASTDNTAEIASEMGCTVLPREGETAWGKEVSARAELWQALIDHSEPGDWLVIMDADQTPANNPWTMFQYAGDAIAFRLFDLWAQDCEGILYYRDDGYWKAHEHPRVWAVRHPMNAPSEWQWSDRGVHCGHLPLNVPTSRILYTPLEYSILHYAYVSPELREAKATQYASVSTQLSLHETAHAGSILDPHPTLHALPFTPTLTLEYAS